jgi:hypothetical protein
VIYLPAMKKSRLFCQISMLLFVFSFPGLSWGPEGHQTVGRMAGLNLNSKAKQQVATILGVAVDAVPSEMAHAATWADTIRPTSPETAPWHFVDIPADQPAGQPSNFCPNNDCVTFRITDFAQRLKTNQAGPGNFAKLHQLRFLIHFAGDVHQPLHSTTNSDRGATCIKVIPSADENLHHVWDSVIVAGLGTDDVALAQKLSDKFQALPAADKQQLVAGTADDWAVAAHQLALSKAYGLLKIPVMKPQVEVKNCATDAPPAVLKLREKISPAYLSQTQPVAQDQLMKA